MHRLLAHRGLTKKRKDEAGRRFADEEVNGLLIVDVEGGAQGLRHAHRERVRALRRQPWLEIDVGGRATLKELLL
ncbi:hypothetical protein [Sandaracinus amylolyticus]|uniref:hypothetical protein n=1 Tax=Sandaracinus amylolyticus TaxID=927083 RepID=UPI001F32DB07|nr:hypothetical protein [Sandaracinus amylolyticus]